MDFMNRRRFISDLVKKSIGLAVIGIVPLGTLTACTESESKLNKDSLTLIGPIIQITTGTFPKKVSYTTKVKDAWVEKEMNGFVYINYKEGSNELLIMSPICTHLGCTAGQDVSRAVENETKFYCPCHGGEYDQYGNNVSGPPPRPLDIFEPVIIDDNLYISIFDKIKRE